MNLIKANGYWFLFLRLQRFIMHYFFLRGGEAFPFFHSLAKIPTDCSTIIQVCIILQHTCSLPLPPWKNSLLLPKVHSTGATIMTVNKIVKLHQTFRRVSISQMTQKLEGCAVLPCAFCLSHARC